MEIAARAIAYATAMILFGASCFVVYASCTAVRDAQDAGLRAWRALRRDMWRLQAACVVATVVAGAIWFAIHTAAISGLPIAQAVSGSVMFTVLYDTLFGQVTLLRLAMALVTAAMLVPGRRAASAGAFDIARAVLAGGLLATMAWLGHAAATPGLDRYVHLGADVMHLLAAGAWLGALAPLALLLWRASRSASPTLRDVATHGAERFSGIGVIVVGALVVTGIVNAWYLVGTMPALFGTRYGQLLLLKLALFAPMLGLAVYNRLRLMPLAAGAASDADAGGIAAMRQIARNALLETALGLAIVLIVGALGTAVPGAHDEIVWPFPFRFDAHALDERAELDLAADFLLLVGALSALAAILAIRRRKRGLIAAGVAAGIVAFGLYGYLVAEPAYPTTYARSPLRYTTSEIAEGATLYAAHCAVCHGANGLGNGPAARSLFKRPADLTAEHTRHHRPGEVFWWLTHGIPGTPMPGFADQLTTTQRWQLVNYVRTLADAQEARSLAGTVGRWRPIVAPDFTFEIGRGEQETLRDQRGRDAVLVVLYTLPASQSRLAALGIARERLARAGIRVLAIPRNGNGPRSLEPDGIDPKMLAVAGASVATAYESFLPERPRSALPYEHAEFLVDRYGYLRAVRADFNEAARDSVSELVLGADRLRKEPPRPWALDSHEH